MEFSISGLLKIINMNSDFEDFDINSAEEDICPSVGMFVDLIMMNKPFGFVWSRDLQIDFLKKLGYKIFEIDKNLTKYPIQIAVSTGSDIVPDIAEMTESNIDEVFNIEIQKILLNWLLKIKTGQ